MDFTSEENVICLALDSVALKVTLEFDTPNRKVRIFHWGNINVIEKRMCAVGLGAVLESNSPVASEAIAQARPTAHTILSFLDSGSSFWTAFSDYPARLSVVTIETKY